MTFKNKNDDNYKVILRSAIKHGGKLDDINFCKSNATSQTIQIENNLEHRLQLQFALDKVLDREGECPEEDY